MNMVDFNDFEIVGFSGSVEIDCEYLLPILKKKTGNEYFSPSEGAPTRPLKLIGSESDISDLEQEGRLTRLPKPMPAFEGAVVLSVTDYFLSKVGFDFPPPTPSGWQQLAIFDKPAWVTCLFTTAAVNLMGKWALRLKCKAEELLVAFLTTRDSKKRDDAKEIAEVALEAAADRDIQYDVYITLGAILAQDEQNRHKLENRHLFIQRKYPELDWDTFIGQVSRLTQTLVIQAGSGPEAVEGISQGGITKLMKELEAKVAKYTALVDNSQTAVIPRESYPPQRQFKQWTQ